MPLPILPPRVLIVFRQNRLICTQASGVASRSVSATNVAVGAVDMAVQSQAASKKKRCSEWYLVSST